jgi:hypothetical protein
MNTADMKQELLQIRAAAGNGRIAILDVEDLADEIEELVEKAHGGAGAAQRVRFTEAERTVLQRVPYVVIGHVMKRIELRLMDIEARAPASLQPAAAPALDIGPLADAIVKATKEFIDQRFAELAAATK